MRRIVIAGGSGFIGRALARELASRGDDVVILTRTPDVTPVHKRVRHVRWAGRTQGAWAREIDGTDAVVNLAGKNVNCRYTRRNLAEIDGSRVDAVRAVGEAIARAAQPPRVLVQASTTAIYGDTGETWCDEQAAPGDGIPVATATKWERAFEQTPTPPATRRVILRIGFVLGREGGVLNMLGGLARCFLGGTVGGGRQYISWIHVDDLVRLVRRAIDEAGDAGMSGVYNAASPAPVTNAVFMRELRRVLNCPWSPPVPAWAVRVGCFIMRTEPVLALTGRRAVPRRLIDEAFEFRFTELRAALEDIFNGPPARSMRPSAP
jgi:uncharacterized protein